MSRADGRVIGTTRIVNNGAAERRWNIVILGDGFVEAEMPLFASAASNIASLILLTPPYSRLRNGINVYRVDVASVESGADDPVGCGGSGAVRRTFFDGQFCNNGIQRLTRVDNGLAWDVARDAVPQAHVVLVILNSPIWGGSGGSVATCSLAPGAGGIAIHEMGHSAFGLADEYQTYRGCGSGETDRNVHGFTFFDLVEPNVTVHEEFETLFTHKWGRFVNPGTPVPTTRNANCAQCDPQPNPFPGGTVGLFEGAHYYHCDAYRPEFNCMMRNTGAPYCRACSEHIGRRLERFMPIPIEDLRNWELVFTARNSGKVLEVEGFRTDNTAPIQQWDWHGGGNQRWRLEYLGDELHKIIAVHSGKVMDVWGISRRAGVPVYQWDWWGGDNQKWAIEDMGEGYCRVVAHHSGLCLSVTGASRDNGADMTQLPWANEDHQKWRISTAELSLFAGHTGKALDVWEVSRANGAALVQWDWWGGGNQKWRLEYVGEGYFKIISSNSGKVLDVEGSSRRNGARVQQWDWHGGENQQWRIERITGGFYKVAARHSGLCLDVSGVSRDNGARVIQWTFVGGSNQLWRIAPAP